MRSIALILLLLLCLPSCRHRHLVHEGCFQVGACHFVPQDNRSHQLCRGAKDGDLIGRIAATRTAVKIQPEKKGRYSRYALRVWAEGGARGSAELAPRGADRCAIVCKDGSVTSSREQPETLPKNWVSLVALEGNICIVAWNRKNGGYNAKFYAKHLKKGDAVYKVLEMDDPRYHHEGVALRELREN